jgi:agmatinase
VKPIAFLDSVFGNAPAARARFHVIPAPMEATVCYGGGTAGGPQAILAASRQLDDFDGPGCPGELGIHTQPAVKPAASRGDLGERWLRGIEKAVARALQAGAIPVILGGEHTATLGSIRAFRAAGMEIGIVHFDAHADLRETYQGRRISHACVLRRIHELGCPLLQIGLRAISHAEREYRRAHRDTITAWDAPVPPLRELPRHWIPRSFPKQVFITFDLDALDPGVIPATGTPVPGGLNWYQALELIAAVAAARKIVGLDVVELAPVKGMHHPDFAAALLVNVLMAAAAGS